MNKDRSRSKNISMIRIDLGVRIDLEDRIDLG